MKRNAKVVQRRVAKATHYSGKSTTAAIKAALVVFGD